MKTQIDNIKTIDLRVKRTEKEKAEVKKFMTFGDLTGYIIIKNKDDDDFQELILQIVNTRIGTDNIENLYTIDLMDDGGVTSITTLIPHHMNNKGDTTHSGNGQ